MPAKNHLSPNQKQRLIKLLKESNDNYVREKLLILLLINDGKIYRQMSDFMEIDYTTLAYWLVHGDPANLDPFLDKRSPEIFRKVTPEYEQILRDTIEKAPEEYGYEFGRWTAARLATYLEKVTEIKLSSSQISWILHKKKYVYIWAKYSLESKQNSIEREVFKQKLSEYLRITFINTRVFTGMVKGMRVDSGEPVTRRKTWGKKGQRKKITGQRRRGRVNLMGGLRYHDKKRLNFVIKRGESKPFMSKLMPLMIRSFKNGENWVIKLKILPNLELRL